VREREWSGFCIRSGKGERARNDNGVHISRGKQRSSQRFNEANAFGKDVKFLKN